MEKRVNIRSGCGKSMVHRWRPNIPSTQHLETGSKYEVNVTKSIHIFDKLWCNSTLGILDIALACDNNSVIYHLAELWSLHWNWWPQNIWEYGRSPGAFDHQEYKTIISSCTPETQLSLVLPVTFSDTRFCRYRHKCGKSWRIFEANPVHCIITIVSLALLICHT